MADTDGDDKAEHTGGMIALVPSAADAAKLTVAHPNGEDADELHTTIGYLGDDVMSQLSADDRGAILASAARVAASHPPVAASVMGHALFNPDDPDRDPCAVYLVTGDGLAAVRGALAEHDRSEFPIWLPHMTAGYGVDPGALSYTGPVTYDRLRVALAGQYHDFPLGAGGDGADDGDEDEALAEAAADGVQINTDDDDGPVMDEDDLDRKADPGDVEVKNKVATQAGATRYHVAIGTELGQARDANAAKAQNNPRAKDQYDSLVNADPKNMRAMLDQLDTADLKSLTAMTYSFRSSNPKVVAARLALAAALRRNGLDVNDYGGLGKSKAKTGAAAKVKTAAKTVAKAKTAKTTTAGRTAIAGSVDQRGVGNGEVGAKEHARLVAEGWKPRPGDKSGRLYPPAKGAPVPDDDNDLPWWDLEGKAAAKGKNDKPVAKSGPKTPGKVKCRFCTADATTRVKRSDSPGGVNVCDKHTALAKAAGGKVTGTEKIGDGDDSGKDSGGGKDSGKAKAKAKSTPPWVKGKALSADDLATLDAHTLVGLIEEKVTSANPHAAKLREYWAHGKGRAKWMPGTPGDFDRLRRHLAKFVPPQMLNGLTANIHKLATGEWPGKTAHTGKGNRGKPLVVGGKDGQPEGIEVKTALLTTSDLDDADDTVDLDKDDDPLGGDDAVSMALDRYGDMADELTSEEAYEQALADQVDWTLTADGTLAPSVDDDLTPDNTDAEYLAPGAGSDTDDGSDDDEPLDPAARLEELFA